MAAAEGGGGGGAPSFLRPSVRGQQKLGPSSAAERIRPIARCGGHLRWTDRYETESALNAQQVFGTKKQKLGPTCVYMDTSIC